MTTEVKKTAPKPQKKKYVVTHIRTVGVCGKNLMPKEEFMAFEKDVKEAVSKGYVKSI